MKLNWKLFAPLVVAILVWLIGAPEGLSANSWIYVRWPRGRVDFRTNATSFYRYHCCYRIYVI